MSLSKISHLPENIKVLRKMFSTIDPYANGYEQLSNRLTLKLIYMMMSRLKRYITSPVHPVVKIFQKTMIIL